MNIIKKFINEVSPRIRLDGDIKTELAIIWYKSDLRNLIEEIENLLSKNKWYNVNEEVPSSPFLVWTWNGKGYRLCRYQKILTWKGRRYKFVDARQTCFWQEDVTHWMPAIPQPPKDL